MRLRITSSNYRDLSTSVGDFYYLDLSDKSTCAVANTDIARAGAPRKISDSIEIVCNAIAFAVSGAHDGRIDQFVRAGRFAGRHHAIEKQFYNSGCNYRRGIKSRDCSGPDGSAAAGRNAFAQSGKRADGSAERVLQ
jgi:hypothetical protein